MAKMNIQSGKISLLNEEGSAYSDNKKVWTMLGIPQTVELVKLVSEDVLVYIDFLLDIPLVFLGHKKMDDAIKSIQSKREAQEKKWEEWDTKDVTKDFVHTFGNYYTTNINDGFGILEGDYERLASSGKLAYFTKQISSCITSLLKPNPDGFVSYIGSILKKFYKIKLKSQLLVAMSGGIFELFNQMLGGNNTFSIKNFNSAKAKPIFMNSWQNIFLPAFKKIDMTLF